MATAEALLTWARSQLGTVEKPPGSNRVPYWDQIGMSHLQGSPWCAAFVLAGLEQVGVGPVTRSVYVPRIRSDYQRARRLHRIDEALPGDQVLFTFGNFSDKTHTGIVESIDTKARTVTSLDGNTTPALGSGVEWNGGGVHRRTRPWSVTWGVGRPAFDPEPPHEVTPMFDPPITLSPVVATRKAPGGGMWQLGVDGSVYAWEGAPYVGGANGKAYFAGRTAARFADLNAAEQAAGKLYVILSKQPGGRYAYPE